jgi:hypothetical protein
MTTKTSDTASTAKIRDGIDDARDRARDAARQTAETIEANPLGVLVGGIALGALVAAILPRGAREKELLAPIGKRVSATAVAAIAAAKEAGKGELESLGLSKGAARDQAKSLFQGVIQAATAAGKAATDAGKGQAKG